MRGLFNRAQTPAMGATDGGFNPPCGCVAFSTSGQVTEVFQKLLVSIRLADAWPFQQALGLSEVGLKIGFNPPCGCVAFSTAGRRRTRPRTLSFQSALRMRGLFNVPPFHVQMTAQMFQSALRMRGLFNHSRP